MPPLSTYATQVAQFFSPSYGTNPSHKRQVERMLENGRNDVESKDFSGAVSKAKSAINYAEAYNCPVSYQRNVRKRAKNLAASAVTMNLIVETDNLRKLFFELDSLEERRLPYEAFKGSVENVEKLEGEAAGLATVGGSYFFGEYLDFARKISQRIIYLEATNCQSFSRQSLPSRGLEPSRARLKEFISYCDARGFLLSEVPRRARELAGI